MSTVRFGKPADDDERRKAIFNGEIFVHDATPAATALVQFTREYLKEAFAPLDPERAQHAMPVAEFAALLADIKPKFIHHPRCKELIRQFLVELGCNPERTYFDVPRLRSSTSDDYLTSGIAYAFHPHRDTWYSAPMCQINWWMPVYALQPNNALAFHPRFWKRGVKNSSNIYNYQEWNRTSRFAAAALLKTDTRPQPKALEPLDHDQPLVLLPEPGSMLAFSAAQLHSSIENTSGVTRYSIDFRTVHIDDVSALRGAHNVDTSSTGTTMGDYLRCSDLAHLPDSVTRPYDNGPPQPSLT